MGVQVSPLAPLLKEIIFNMNFFDHYSDAELKFDNFINDNILNYSHLRNYDFGIIKRDNVSNLSKYISHRVLFEFDLIDKTLRKYPFAKVEKFIQEIFWRVYWKNNLEFKTNVWNDFLKYDINSYTNANYIEAINANTDIECFNEWVKELKEYNYLHNHTRMWFASIWIFSLKLPWQLGARFFLEHLLDGDAAVNTLSWRWVAGLHTKGKHYIAKSWNIEKFTNLKFKNINLNETPEPIIEEAEYTLNNVNYNSLNRQLSDTLIIFENDLFFSNQKILFSKYTHIFVIILDNSIRNIKLNEKVIDFKKELGISFTNNVKNSTIISNKDIFQKFKGIKNLDIVYPFIGENLDFINNFAKDHDIALNFLHRKEDVYCLEFSKKGFFNFKKNIPQIIQLFCKRSN